MSRRVRRAIDPASVAAGEVAAEAGIGVRDAWRVGDWLCTSTGVLFYPFDPRPDEVNIEDIAHALSQTCRFGGHCRTFYSVAEHSVRVAEHFIKRTAFRNDGTGMGTPGACLAALLHDASEAYILDVPPQLKRNLVGYADLERRVQQAVWDRFGIDGYDARHAAIKTCDNILLATEKRDLMPATSGEWSSLPTPLDERIDPWSSATARAIFLSRFVHLAAVLRDHVHEEAR